MTRFLNHFVFVLVFDILLRVSEGQTWKDALMDVLPERKFRKISKRQAKLLSAEGKTDEIFYEDGNVEEIVEEIKEGIEEKIGDQVVEEKPIQAV